MPIAEADFERKSVRLPAGVMTYDVGGSGRPVLYLHGADGIRIPPALRELADRFRIVVPVMPGFEGTDRLPGVATMTDLAGLLAAFAEQAIGGRYDVVGHGFGGCVAAWLTVLDPDGVGQLVLESATGFQPPGSEDPGRASRNHAVAGAYMGGRGGDEALLARLGEIGCLTLIMQGTKDGIAAAEGARLIKSRIRRSHLIFVYDAAHAIAIDQPARFAALVGDFLGRAEGFLVNWTGHVSDPAGIAS